jgi:16S rRNA (cytosine1402-N4)-methyltransferase
MQPNLWKKWLKMKNNEYHEPVMAQEALYYLGLDAPLKKRAYKVIDATLGTGGYTLKLCEIGADVLGIDTDERMLEIARKRLDAACPAPDEKVGGSFKLIHGNFKDIADIAEENGFQPADGVVFDLGVSTLQLTGKKRGFSFSEKDVPLDMRLDKTSQGAKASDLLNALRGDQLIDMFEKVLGHNKARKLSNEIVERRKEAPIETVGDFLSITNRIFERRGRLHPATKPFLALRMATNSELENLEEALPKAVKVIKEGGKLVVVSFHSGEDEIVKDFFKRVERDGNAKVLTRSPITPSEVEVNKNPKARSAKLRALEKI